MKKEKREKKNARSVTLLHCQSNLIGLEVAHLILQPVSQPKSHTPKQQYPCIISSTHQAIKANKSTKSPLQHHPRQSHKPNHNTSIKQRSCRRGRSAAGHARSGPRSRRGVAAGGNGSGSGRGRGGRRRSRRAGRGVGREAGAGGNGDRGGLGSGEGEDREDGEEG